MAGGTSSRRLPQTTMIAALLLVALCWVAAAPASAFRNVTTLRFEEGYSPLFGDSNLVRSGDGRNVRLLLDRYTGSGFISSDLYNHGFFSAKIKLPADYTAGVVVAFYTSNGDIYEKTHDELDFEFLGNVRGRPWKIQTNVYGNGSTYRGREERYVLPFDPTRDSHRYSIFWSHDTIIFYVDDIPIREVNRSAAMGADYPSKPMALYATIWDGSSWATEGGKVKVSYKYSPFAAEFSDLVLQGCRVDPIEQVPSSELCAAAQADLLAAEYAAITPDRRRAMRRFREKYMTYSFCYDRCGTRSPSPTATSSPQRRTSSTTAATSSSASPAGDPGAGAGAAAVLPSTPAGRLRCDVMCKTVTCSRQYQRPNHAYTTYRHM